MAPASEFDYKRYLQLIVKRKYRFVIIALIIMTGTVATTYFLPEKYEAKCTVFIEKSVISELVKGIAVTPSLDDKIKVLAHAIKSRTSLLKVIDDLDLNINKSSDAQREEMVKELQDRTNVRLNDKEGLFTITFTDKNPRLARDFVNSLVRRYIEENAFSKREESYGANKFLSEQITPVKEKLAELEAREDEFIRANALTIGESEPAILSEINLTQQRIEENAIRLSQLQALRDMNRGVNPLKAKLAELQKRLRELTIVYTDNYPEVIELKNQIESVSQLMKSGYGTSELPVEDGKINAEMNALRQSDQNMRRLIATKRSLLRSIPTTRTALESLAREKEMQKNLYNQLLARYGQSEVSVQMEVQDKTTNLRIVDPAVMPTKPVSPNRVKMIFLGIIAGVAGGLAILVLFDYLDTSVRDLDTLKSLGVPILAVVPKIENPAELAKTRKRDVRFFIAAAAYFSFILAILSVEIMREFSIDLPGSAAQVRLDLGQLKDTLLNR